MKKNTNTERANVSSLPSMFLLGVICANSSINYQYKQLTVTLPMTKAHITKELKYKFGGSAFTQKFQDRHLEYAKWQLRSSEGLKKLNKLAIKTKNRYKDNLFLNDLIDFTSSC